MDLFNYQASIKVTGYSLLINFREKNITFLFFVQDPGMHAFNFTAKKSCIKPVTAVLVGWAEYAI